MDRPKLGRGLGALLGKQVEEPEPTEQVLRVPLSDIRPNPWQPRSVVTEESLRSLVESIRSNGVLQPIVLRRRGDGGYELVAGERRWRAAAMASMTEIPAVVRNVADNQMLLLALLENIQRENLNSIERAHGYVQLMRTFEWTQEELAEHVHEARATVANTVRLLELPEELRDLVSRGTITAGHARALLALKDPDAQRRLCERIIKESLSVRQAEDIVNNVRVTIPGTPRRRAPPPHIRELQERLQRALGAKVTIKERKRGGRVTIDFFTHDDFERVLNLLERGGPAGEGGGAFHV
jgi:ParB family chromosome partitioning protein